MVDTTVQGSAADLLKQSLLKVNQILLQKENIHLILQIHDELLFVSQSFNLYYRNFLCKMLNGYKKNSKEACVIFQI
jgi:DNA polymerase I-like protein with 3'-5' exonuclease and polymerase domains